MVAKPPVPTLEQIREEIADPPSWMIRRVWNHLLSEGFAIQYASDERCQALQDADDLLRQILENHGPRQKRK